MTESSLLFVGLDVHNASKTTNRERYDATERRCRMARATPETDLTSLVFDQRGILLGWGRDLLSEHIKRYEELQGMGVSAEKAISVAEGGKRQKPSIRSNPA